MRTRSSSNLVGETSTNPKRRNRRRSKQIVEPFSLEETLVVTMADQRFEKEDPHAHIRYFNKITSTLKYKDVPESSIKLMLFPFSIDGPARIWLDKEPSRSILTWDDLDLLRECPHHGFTELHQLDTFYNGFNPSDQDSLNSAAGGNLLERSAQDVLKIIEKKSKVRNSKNKPIVSQVKASNVDSSEIASAVASDVTSAMTAMFKQHQVTPAPASVKAVEESCVTCGGVVTDIAQKDKNEAKQTKPGTGMERVQEIKAEGKFIQNPIPLNLYPKRNPKNNCIVSPKQFHR
ncbi:hypothetical protein Tco_0205513 [Tanacetum coccineum]